jgi:CheY-like chemotaxis protein
MSAPASIFGASTRPAAADPVLRARDERLEALKAVVGKLAHDFNNFLVPQFGYLTLIAEELAADSSASQYLKTAENAARTTEGYIETILLAVRPQRQYAPKDFDLGSVLAELVERWGREVPHDPGVEVTQEIVPAEFHGDERHWRKAFEHLLANARYALATGGRMKVSLAAVELEAEEVSRLGVASSSVYRLAIEDSGFGMAEEVQARAFEPFFTTHGQVRGSGLGLTIVHSVTQFHGGQVELSSVEERGTRVTLWVPRTPPAAARTTAGGLLRQRPAKKRKVLLVEDDPMVKEVLKTWLAGQGFDAQVVEGSVEAGKALSRDTAGWTLVITETVLKSGRGEEVYELVSKVDGLACIFLAGRERPRLDGAAAAPLIVEKPISFRALLEVIQKHARVPQA